MRRFLMGMAAVALGLAVAGAAEAKPGSSGAGYPRKPSSTGSSNYHPTTHHNTVSASGNTVRKLTLNTSYATKPLSGKPTGYTDAKYRNYNLSHGIKGSFGWYYKGKDHYHWSHCCYHPTYGCKCYWCPCACCYYYWCVPDCCYYPVTYCPYDCYSWAE